MQSNQEVYEQIRDSLDISELISERVKLRPASRGYSGLCPFHEEDTPSFHVYTDTQSYYCFGCHESGNIFTFLMKSENLSFPEALKVLSERAGISLREHKPNDRTSYDILELAARFYADELNSSHVARTYLERRKLEDTDMKRYTLGYAPESWDALVRYLRDQKVTDKQIQDLGLGIPGRNGLYDRFRGRIIFPIRSITGRVIAFGGRIITGEGAKYINSSESEIYHKRRNLYMLDRARNAIREKKRSILVEGYMDAIRLHKNGFTETVASLGTSLTQEQAELLSRYADRCYICYDSDKAGKNASLKSMFVLQKHGLDVYVIEIPDGKDPDEYLSDHEAKDFEGLISQSKPLIVQHIESFKASLSDPLTRKSSMKELFTSLLELEVHEVLQYKMQFSEATGIPPSKIEEWYMSKQKREIPEEVKVQASQEVKSSEHPSESALCSLLFHHAEFRLRIPPEKIMKYLRNPEVRRVIHLLLNEDVETLMLRWTETGDTEYMGIISRGEEICRRMKGLTLKEKFMNVCQTLRERYKSMRIRELTVKMQKSQATTDELLELSKLKSEQSRKR